MNRTSQRPACRRKSRQLALAATLALLTSAAPAQAGGLLEEPCFATCGQYRWFLKKSAEVRDNATCCIPLIRQAKVKEERALELYEEASRPGNSEEQGDLVREANRLIGKRGRLIRKFIDCVNGVQSALNLKKRGLDPLAEYAAACGVALECEESFVP